MVEAHGRASVGSVALYALPVLFALLMATMIRNTVWMSVETLYADTVAKSPLKERPHINLAQAYQMQGRYGSAIREYQAAELISLDDPDKGRAQISELFALLNITHIFEKTGHIEEAHQILKQGWLKYPGFPGFAVNISVFYLRNNEPDKALYFLNEGIAALDDYKWFMDRGLLFVNRGVAYQMKGDCFHARLDYQEAHHYPDMPKTPECLETP